MTSDTPYAYAELRALWRALCADLLTTRGRAARQQLLAAIARHLQAHCLRCGGLLSAAGRADPREELCELCLAQLIPPPPPGYPDPLDERDVPF